MPQYMVTRFVLKVSVMSFILKCEQYQKSQFVMADPVYFLSQHLNIFGPEALVSYVIKLETKPIPLKITLF